MSNAEGKLEAVRAFLRDNFPGHSVADAPDVAQESQLFSVDRKDGRIQYRFRVALRFLEEFAAVDIPGLLRTFGVVALARQAGPHRHVIVTSRNAYIERAESTERDASEGVS
jgi:hypothetical protein